MVTGVVLALCLAQPAGPNPVAVLDAAGLEVRGAFSDAELQAFSDALALLPEPYRRVPGGRVRLVLDESLAPTAAGIAEPEWRDGDFVLTKQAGHVSFRDAALDDDARRLLWRQRALVHAVLARHDDVHRWSQQPQWRRTNGWLLPFERPLTIGEHALNHARTAYARPRGEASARLDFLTFAESALVPVSALPTDELLRCQEFTRLRALHALLGGAWKPEPCPAFDAWVRPDELESLEVLLVQASSRAPESLFGHLLVRPVWKTSLGPSFDTVIQFAAITLQRAGPAHVVKGLFGGYSLGVFTISQTDLEREKLSGEQRSMTRWRLNLSADERLRFMERAWEWERRGRFSYAFFSDNCATLLVWMLESALDDATLVRWPGFITSPGGVLDDLFRAKRKDGTRLLSAVFPSFEATAMVARRDDARRKALEKALGLPSPRAGGPGEGEGKILSFDGVRDPQVEVRRAAYARIADASRTAPPSQHDALFTWWALSARVERSVADVALHDRRELEANLVEGEALDLDALWTERLDTLERETVLQQRMMMLDRDAYLDDVRRRAKQRPMTPSEAEELAGITARLTLFDEVTKHQGALTSEVFTSSSAPAFLEEEVAALVATEVTPAARSLPVSGHFRTGLGAGLWRRDDGSFTPVVRLDQAGLHELLGEQRLRGLGAPVGVRMLEGSLTLAPSLPQPQFVQSHFNLIAFDSIAPAMPPSPAWQDFVGFGFEVGTDFRAWRSQHTLTGVAGWAHLHVQGDRSRHFLLLGAGPAGWLAADATGASMPMGGVTSRAMGRLGLSLDYPSALRFEVRHQSLWGPGRVMHELRGDVSLEWIIAWGGRPRVLVRPTASVTAEPALQRLNASGLVMLEAVESLADLH